MLQSILQQLQKLSNDFKLYTEKRIELLTLQAAEKASTFGASIISVMLVSAVILVALIFLLSALVIWLNIWVAFPAFGQLLVGSSFLILATILLVTKNRIDLSLKKSIEKKLLENDDNNGVNDSSKLLEP